MNEIRVGDCLQLMKYFAVENVRVQTCITSPPYFGLRDYGVDGQLGLEKTPAHYVARLVNVFRLVRRLLAEDGTLWLNLGDSYCGSWGNYSGANRGAGRQREIVNGSSAQNPAWEGLTGYRPAASEKQEGLKPKDIIGIPWRVAFALQADGWYLRSDIIWAKPNPMPESVTDRPTKSHEYIFLFSKSADYFYDGEAIKEDANWPEGSWGRSKYQDSDTTGMVRSFYGNGSGWPGGEKRNKRTVWNVATQPYDGAHFATFPPDLILPCVLAGSRPGDIVFDPFMGSGTTALVAKQNGRKYLGCELNPKYAALWEERLRQEVLFGPEAK